MLRINVTNCTGTVNISLMQINTTATCGEFTYHLAPLSDTIINVRALGYLPNDSTIYLSNFTTFETTYIIFMQIIPPVTIQVCNITDNIVINSSEF